MNSNTQNTFDDLERSFNRINNTQRSLINRSNQVQPTQTTHSDALNVGRDAVLAENRRRLDQSMDKLNQLLEKDSEKPMKTSEFQARAIGIRDKMLSRWNLVDSFQGSFGPFIKRVLQGEPSRVHLINELFGLGGSFVAHFNEAQDVRRYKHPHQVCEAVLDMFRRHPSTKAITYISKRNALVEGFPRVNAWGPFANRVWTFDEFFEHNAVLFRNFGTDVLFVVIYVACILFWWAERTGLGHNLRFSRVRGGFEYELYGVSELKLDGSLSMRQGHGKPEEAELLINAPPSSEPPQTSS